jgi:hypothetical protein
MSKFIITETRPALEIWTYTVEAESQIEALEKVISGKIENDDYNIEKVFDIESKYHIKSEYHIEDYTPSLSDEEVNSMNQDEYERKLEAE